MCLHGCHLSCWAPPELLPGGAICGRGPGQRPDRVRNPAAAAEQPAEPQPRAAGAPRDGAGRCRGMRRARRGQGGHATMVCTAQRHETKCNCCRLCPPGGADWAAEGAAGSAAARQHAQGGQGVPLGQQRATWLGNVQPAACKPPHAPASMQASDQGIHAASTTCPSGCRPTARLARTWRPGWPMLLRKPPMQQRRQQMRRRVQPRRASFSGPDRGW